MEISDKEDAEKTKEAHRVVLVTPQDDAMRVTVAVKKAGSDEIEKTAAVTPQV